MIPFFRKIRKTLADDNKPIKYLRYAIGEIVLVVIGILIALSINNWNEARKERLEEREILSDLQLDIRVDIEKINYQLDFKKEMISNYRNCLEILADKKAASKSEFMEGFKSILQVGDVSVLSHLIRIITNELYLCFKRVKSNVQRPLFSKVDYYPSCIL